MQDYWKTKLRAFDAELCKMVESLTEQPCEPNNGGNHYFIEIDYSKHNDPKYILAIWDAVEGRAGKRLISLKDDPERQCLWARIRFYDEPCADAAFIPKVEPEIKCCICGNAVELDENGNEDEAGNFWCDDCLNEFQHRAGLLVEQMKREKATKK